MPLITNEQQLHGELDGHPVHLTYRQYSRIAGAPGQIENDLIKANTVDLEIGAEEYHFIGSEIVTTATPIGALATLDLFVVPDLGRTTLSFLVPSVSDPVAGDEVDVHTIGVRCLAKSSLMGPLSNTQSEVLTTVKLHGTQSVSGVAQPAAAN